MHFLRRIRLHFLLKSLLPWSLVFESFYPVLPEHLTTQSFVLTSWLCSVPHQHQDFQGNRFFYSKDCWRSWPALLHLLHYFWCLGLASSLTCQGKHLAHWLALPGLESLESQRVLLQGIRRLSWAWLAAWQGVTVASSGTPAHPLLPTLCHGPAFSQGVSR